MWFGPIRSSGLATMYFKYPPVGTHGWMGQSEVGKVLLSCLTVV